VGLYKPGFWLQSIITDSGLEIISVMARILLLIILVWILYQIVKRIAASANPKPTEYGIEEKFVQCTNCGCHVPIGESLIKNNKIYCNNPECLNLDDKKEQHGD